MRKPGFLHSTFGRISPSLTEDTHYLVITSVVISTFFIGFGGGVVFPIIPNLGVILGISPFIVGIILSASSISRLFANAPAGILVDRIGTRKPFIAGMFIQGVATCGYIVAILAPGTAAWFIATRVFWGAGSALVFATAYTIAADVSDDRSRGTSMGLIRGGSLFGVPTGLVLGGIVSELAGTIPAFFLASVLAFFATSVAYMTIPETHVTPGTQKSISPWDVDTSAPAITVGMVNFSMLLAYEGAFFATLVLFLGEAELSIASFGPQGTSGIFMAVTVIASGIFMFVGGYVTDNQRSRVPTLIFFLLMTSAGFSFLAASESLVLLTVACIVLGTGQGGTAGPLMALLADLTPNEQMGRAVGTNNVFGDIGAALGPVVALSLIGLVGFVPVLLAAAMLPLFATVVLLCGIFYETGEINPSIGTS